MVRYAIVRYTKEVIGYADGENFAKSLAKGFAKKDYNYNEDCYDVWYEIEPDHVY